MKDLLKKLNFEVIESFNEESKDIKIKFKKINDLVRK
jgi:hypothetical protein